ncbi:MAG: class I SAM-dependent methyltransferase [Mycobacteriales bacterium]
MLPWDHNAYYHRLVLRAVPDGAEQVLEVGCGTGQLAAELAAGCGHVTAVDRDAGMIAAARAAVPDNVTCTLADIAEMSLEPGSYDAVVSVSMLHHLALPVVLPRLAEALRPGGVLVAVAVPKRDLPRELLVELAASLWHHGLGIFLVLSRFRHREHLRHSPLHAAMPIRDPVSTTRDVRREAGRLLPGSTVRRLLLWRYLLVWRKPGPGAGAR